MQAFLPHLDVLPAAQRRLWGELAAVPEGFVLYGGTALALHLGHRKSLAFDFFGNNRLSLPGFEAAIPLSGGSENRPACRKHIDCAGRSKGRH